MKILSDNWIKNFTDELQISKKLRIISPFIQEHMIRKIQDHLDLNNLELITRFNLQDFALRVSSLKGLKLAVQSGAKVYGIKELHSKVYLFDHRLGVVTSANLTRGGLISNYECGIGVTDKSIITELQTYFEKLKMIGQKPLTLAQCENWEIKLKSQVFSKGDAIILPDFGSSIVNINQGISHYIKFFGTASNRVSLEFKVTNEIERALCHYACGFPKNKKPRQVNDGDIIFMARMTEDPDDYAIFGRAIAYKFKDGRDIASAQEISERDWKEVWPIYLRVRKPIFINTSLNNCIFLSDLMDKFEYNSFPSTRVRFDKGEVDIRPTKSLMQKPYIKLTPESASWLEYEFQQTLNSYGQVEDNFIRKLPKSTTII